MRRQKFRPSWGPGVISRADMPLEDYPEDFVTGVLIGAWDQVYSMILEAHPLPF